MIESIRHFFFVRVPNVQNPVDVGRSVAALRNVVAKSGLTVRGEFVSFPSRVSLCLSYNIDIVKDCGVKLAIISKSQ